MGLNHTPESKVMTVWIWLELSCSNSSLAIYYWLELDIRVKYYDHLNFSSASVVQFRASRYIMGLNHTPESKVMAVWICRELSSSNSSVSIYDGSYSSTRVKSHGCLNLPYASMFNFERLDILLVWTGHPSQKLWSIEFALRFHVEFQASRYIIGLNWTSES